MRWLVLACVLAVVASFGAACGDGGVTSGTVTERVHVPGYTELYSDVGCSTTGGVSPYSGQFCAAPAEPRFRRVPDRWYLELRRCEGVEDDGVTPRCETGRVKVNKSAWDTYTVGEEYP